MRILFLVFLLSACAHQHRTEVPDEPAHQATHEQKHRPQKPKEQTREPTVAPRPQGNPIEED